MTAWRGSWRSWWHPRGRSGEARAGASDAGVAARPPARDQRRVLVGGILPDEVSGVEQVELAFRQPLVKELGVGRGYHAVPRAVDDLYRRLDRRQQVRQDGELPRVGLHVA